MIAALIMDNGLTTTGPATVGPLTLTEHIVWFVVLSLMVFLVYNGLRTESIGEAIANGLRRWVVFAGGTALLGVAFHLFTRWL